MERSYKVTTIFVDYGMRYAYSKDIKSNFQATEATVRDALMAVGFGVLTKISIKDSFKQKLDIDYKNYKILGACNPGLAHEALGSESLIGILMPCNVLVIDNENGTTKVVFPNAKSLLEIKNIATLMKETFFEPGNKHLIDHLLAIK